MTVISRLPVKGLVYGLVLIFAVVFVTSENGFAVASQTNTAKTSVFCKSLDSKSASLLTRIDALTAKLTSAWNKRDQNFTSKWQEIDKNVATKRSQADSLRFNDYAKIEAKAKTDTQVQAVRAYENSINSAIGNRRASYDTARQTFRTGVKSAIEGRRSTVTTQLSTYQNSVNSAIKEAKGVCDSSTKTSAVIKQSLQSSLKLAQTTYKISRSNDSSVNDQIKLLANARDVSFRLADQVFQTSASAASGALKQAFDDDSI